MRLSTKLVLGISTVIVTITLVNAIARIHREAQLFETDIERDNRTLGRAIARAVEHAWPSSGEAGARSLIADADAQEADVHLRWVWLDAPAGDPSAPAVPIDRLGAGWRERFVRWRPSEDEPDRMYVYHRVEAGARPAAIELWESLDAEQRYLRSSIAQIVGEAVAMIGLSMVIVLALGHAFVGRPVRRLVEHAHRIGEGDFDTRLALRQRDEIGHLAASLDTMAERLRVARVELERETTARLSVVEQLRHAERLATVGQLGAGVAHELGTPLNVVIGHAQMIAEDHPAPSQTHEHAGVIAQQARRAAAIIRQLLDFARRRSPQRTPTNLRELAAHTTKLVEPLAAKRRITLALDGDPVTAEVDAGHVQQAITNLVVNAIDASAEGGTVRVAIGRGRAAPPTGGNERPCAWIAVIDHGAGMPPDVLARVFEPFYTTKQPGAGTGLGLPVTYGIARDHGGWIDVTSRVGEGSTFRLVLPEAA
ncbi:MAG TPA: ATP-binding protein [Kofleriaceae bacterium]|nr:ATP-binding protein [Kofleriaceae bacterium]